MPIPDHIAFLRERVGHVTLLTPAAVAIIRDDVGQVLLIRRGDGGGWSLPGGVMEPGERLDQCLVREVQEETGLDVEPARLIGVYSDPGVNHITFPNAVCFQYLIRPNQPFAGSVFLAFVTCISYLSNR